jgi:glycosyltransferase involved in cell wall biosynthesis
MIIAVNTRLLLPDKLEGIGWFTFETLKRITVKHPEHHFIFIFDRPFSDEFIFSDNITPVVVYPPTRHPLLWYFWFEWRIPSILRKYNCGFFLSPDGYLTTRTNIPQLPVMHDLNFIHRPKGLPWSISKFYNFFFPRYASIAKRIATVSQFSKEDISETFGIGLNNIDVVYSGYNRLYSPVPEDEQAGVRKRITGGEPYFLYVGALHPRKNIEGILLSYDRFRMKSENPVKLVIAGGKMFKTGRIFKTYSKMQFRDEVIFTGRVSNAELRLILGSALALVFIPFFEGFGLPLIEAMGAGVPVICSDTTSLPEVGGDAALYTDPNDHGQIADAMLLISRDELLRRKLIDKGLQRKDIFTWDRTADLLWESILKATGPDRQREEKKITESSFNKSQT